MRLRPLVLSAMLLAIALTAPSALAAGNQQKRNRAKPKAEARAGAAPRQATPLYARFDADANGELDAAELDAIRKAFAAGDAEVRKLDGNADGVLITDEILAVPARVGDVAPADQVWKKKKAK